MARFLSRQTLRTSGRPPRPRTALHTKVRAPTSASCARELETHQQSARPVPARVTSLPIFRLAGSLCTHASKRIKNGVDFQLISHTNALQSSIEQWNVYCKMFCDWWAESSNSEQIFAKTKHVCYVCVFTLVQICPSVSKRALQLIVRLLAPERPTARQT